MNVAGFEIPCTGISIPMPSSVNAGASPATAPPTFSKRSTSAGTAASSTDHEHDNGHDQQHAEDLLRKWKYDDELQLCSKTQKMNMNMNITRGDQDHSHIQNQNIIRKQMLRGQSNKSINSNRSTSTGTGTHTNREGDGDEHVNTSGDVYSSNFVLHGHHSPLKQQLQSSKKSKTKSKSKPKTKSKTKHTHVRHVSHPVVSTHKLELEREQVEQFPPDADYSISIDSTDDDDDNIGLNRNRSSNDVHGHSRARPGRIIDRSESFGNVSHISGLSADETHYEGSGYGHHSHGSGHGNVQGHGYYGHLRNGYTHGHSNSTGHIHGHGHGHRSPRSSHRVHPLLNPDPESGKMGKGRDFGDAFDHLIHGKDDSANGAGHAGANGRDKRSDPSGSSSGKGGGPGGHPTHYRVSSSSGRRTEKNLQRPTHLRAHTDTMALRGVYVPGNLHTKSKTLPAHATLRERIAKPQILQSRSTSNTVQSFSSTSTSGGNGKNGVVWNGQSMPTGAEYSHHNFHQQNQTQHPQQHNYHLHLPHVPSMGSGSGSYPSTTADTNEESSAANSASASNGSHQTQTSKLLGTRPRRCLHSPHTRSHSYGHGQSDDGGDNKSLSLQDVPEDDPSTKWNDAKSTDGKSVFSESTSTSMSGRKRVIKDEIKFIVTKFVPARLRKSRSKNVTLERSEGCLA